LANSPLKNHQGVQGDQMDNVTGLFEAAIAKDKSGEGSEALRLLDTLLEYQPGHRLGRFYRGGVKIRYRRDVDNALKDWEDAFEGAPPGSAARVRELYPLFVESCIEKLISLTSQEPDNASYHSGFARASLLFDQPELGERHLRRARDLDKSRGIDGVRLGEYLISRGKTEEGLNILTKQVELSPDSWEAHSALGLYCKSVSRTAQALKHLEAAAALHPRHVPTRQALGDIYLAQARMDQAESHFKFLQEHAPSASVYLGLAECDKQQYRFEEALQNHKKAVEIEPKNFHALFELGQLALQIGDLDLGIASLKSALLLERGHPEIHGLLAKAALQKGDRQEAINALRFQLQLDPQDGFACYTLATQLRAMGNYQEARDLLLTALQTRSSDVQVSLDLAECHVELGQLELAHKVLREAYERNPTREDLRAALAQLDPEAVKAPVAPRANPEVDDSVNLARAHLHAGRTQEAFDAFRKVLQLAPQNSEALAGIGRIYGGKRMLEPAAEFLLRAYAAEPTNLPLLLDYFGVLNQMAGRQAYPALDQLARCLPQDTTKVAWLDYLWRNQEQPGIGRLLPPLVESVKKAYPPQHPVAQQWVALQFTAPR